MDTVLGSNANKLVVELIFLKLMSSRFKENKYHALDSGLLILSDQLMSDVDGTVHKRISP